MFFNILYCGLNLIVCKKNTIFKFIILLMLKETLYLRNKMRSFDLIFLLLFEIKNSFLK